MKSSHVFSRKPDLSENPKAEAPKGSFCSQETVQIRLVLLLGRQALMLISLDLLM